MAHVNLTIEIPGKSIEDLRAMLDWPHPRQLRKILSLIGGVLNGTYRGYVRTQLASARASQTINVDVSDMVADTDTTVIDGTTLTWVAASADENQITIPATDALGAAALAAAINAHSTISKICFAVVTASATGDVTVYAKTPGTAGNGITLAEAGNGITLGAAALAGGAGDEVDEYARGYDPATALAG